MISTIRFARDNPFLAKKLLRIRISNTIGWNNSDDYKKFIILGSARTGSNLLMDMLNSNSSIYADGEVFCYLNGRSVESILNRYYCEYPRFIKAAGFKIF